MTDENQPKVSFHPFWGWKSVVPAKPLGAGYSEYLYRKLDRREAERRLAKNAEIDRREAERWMKFNARCRAAKRIERGMA